MINLQEFSVSLHHQQKPLPINKNLYQKPLDILRNMIDNLHSEDAGAPLSIPSQSHLGSLDTSSIFDMVGSTIQKPVSKSATTSTRSLGDLSTTMELERSKETRKSELSPQAREALRMAYECLAEMHNIVVTPELMTVWSSHRKASTVNGYANSFRLWDNYCKMEGVKSLPVNENYLAAWLAAASLQDKTASPTDNRSAAVVYFNSIVCSRDTDS